MLLRDGTDQDKGKAGQSRHAHRQPATLRTGNQVKTFAHRTQTSMLPRSGPQDAKGPFGATSKDRAMPSGFSSPPPPPPLQGWRALFWSDVCARVPRPVSRSVGGGLSTAPITCPRRKPRRPISSLDFRRLARRDANLHPIFPPRTAPPIPAHPCPGFQFLSCPPVCSSDSVHDLDRFWHRAAASRAKKLSVRRQASMDPARVAAGAILLTGF
jgi:hypothetical protein